MRWRTVFLVSLFTCAASFAAHAGEPAYSAKDILGFFAEQQKTRALCVGTEQDCGIDDKKPAGFNLRVTFEKNSAALTEDAKVNLNVFAEALKSDSLKGASFSIEGFTDASGTDAYNLSLSERRAESVVSYLDGLGVDKAMLQPKGYGETSPLGEDPLDPANRRVETRLQFPAQ
jgi:outer membrane protein OmpA-like peptidoglycan-associated protein